MADREYPGLGPPLLSLAEAAEWCGVHPRTLIRAIEKGRLKARKIAGRWRIRPEDLDDFEDPREQHDESS